VLETKRYLDSIWSRLDMSKGNEGKGMKSDYGFVNKIEHLDLLAKSNSQKADCFSLFITVNIDLTIIGLSRE